MWMDIAIAALFVAGSYAFVTLVGWRTRDVTRRSSRTAENLYGQYADSVRTQRRYARRHGGSWTDEQHKG